MLLANITESPVFYHPWKLDIDQFSVNVANFLLYWTVSNTKQIPKGNVVAILQLDCISVQYLILCIKDHLKEGNGSSVVNVYIM